MKGFTLVCIEGDLEGQIYPLSPGRTDCGRRIKEGILIADPKVSGLHCVFFVTPDRKLVVRDASSANGVYWNGSKVNDSQELAAGDRLVIGNHVFEIRGGHQ